MTFTEREIRDCLLGRTIPLEKGRLRAMGPDDYRLPIGVGDGAWAVRFFGVGFQSRVLSSELSETELLRTCKKSMHKVGRSLLLLQQPDNPACLIRYVTTSPAIVLVHYMDELPVVTAYAGRSLTGWISILRALASFERQLPEEITISGQKAPKESRRERRAREREERKEIREAKKDYREALREERRAARFFSAEKTEPTDGSGK